VFAANNIIVYISQSFWYLLKVNKPTLPLASGEFSVPTAVLLVVSSLVMVCYKFNRDLRTIYSGQQEVSFMVLYLSHIVLFLQFVRALASE